MSYQVLASKWRPKNFEEMVGQSHVLRALVNALDNDRVHHAFLYSGTRGVGKTTIARILAKALNCEQGVSSKPCCECSSCIEIDEGHFIDLIEVDAASRTKVEDTRELLENVQYAPTRGRFKIYLIDEVHMLSTHSFNALLKTLEEPPPHVKFLLATTDPQKLPVTILSRCLQFNLKRLPIDQISQQLEKILKTESIKYEAAAVKAIARAADGSMRDGLSLLDQAISFGNETLNTEDVLEMLGTIEQTTLYDLLKSLAAGDANAVMKTVNQAAELGPNFNSLLDDLISMLHRIALAQMVPSAVDDWYEDKEKLLELAQDLDEEQVQLFYQICLHGKKDLPFAPDAKNGFEMLLLRMLAFQPRKPKIQANKIQANKIQANDVSSEQLITQSSQTTSAPILDSKPNLVENQNQSNSGIMQLAGAQAEWFSMTQRMDTAATTKQLAENSILIEKNSSKIILRLNSKLKQLNSKNSLARLEKALQSLTSTTLILEIETGDTNGISPAEVIKQDEVNRQKKAVESVKQDSVVQEMQNVLGATLLPDYVQAVKPSD